MQIEPGSKVVVRSADDRQLERRAITGVQDGTDFLVVWVCPEEEWVSSHRDGREPNGVPWPANEVKPIDEAA